MHDKLTSKDIEKMQAEIEHRKVVVRKELLESVKEARAHGDLSENFEYKAAKREKNMNESRIRYLEKMVKTAHIITEESREDEVGVNNTVLIYIPEDNVRETYKIVTTVRGNSRLGLITMDSPLGKALLGRKVGEQVTIQVSEQYSYDATIEHIENTVDDGSDQLRGY